MVFLCQFREEIRNHEKGGLRNKTAFFVLKGEIMPATNVNEYFIEAKPLWVGKVGAGGVASAVAGTFPLQSASGLTDGNVYVVTANRVNSAGTIKNPSNERETFIGKLSGTNLINCIRQVEGEAQAWEADTVLEILVTGAMWNKLIDGLEVEHNPNGTHKMQGFDESHYAEDEASDDDYVITLSPVPVEYFEGMIVNFKATTVNTGACTLNVNELGAKSIKTPNGEDPANGQIPAGSIVTVIYDGTNFILSSIGGLASKSYVDTEISGIDVGKAFLYQNAIINGACQINQIVTAVNLTTGKLYGTDTFYAKGAGTAVSAGTISNTASPSLTTAFADKLAGVTLTGTGIVYGYRNIDSANAIHYKNKTASFSVLVRHDVGSAINYTIKINKANSANNFSAVTNIATGDAVSVESGADTLIKLEGVSMGDCSNGIEIEIIAECGAITTKNFEFSEWQYNLGDKVLSFNAKSEKDELRACRKYCRGYLISNVGIVASGLSFNDTTGAVEFLFDEPMLKTPTLIATASDWKFGFISGSLVDLTSMTLDVLTSQSGSVLIIGVTSGLGTGVKPGTLVGDGGGVRNLVFDARPTIA